MQALEVVVGVVLPLDSLPRGHGQLLPQRWLSGELGQHAARGLRVVGVHNEAVHTVRHGLSSRREARKDHRSPQCLSLEHNVWQAVMKSRVRQQAKDVARFEGLA